MVAALLEVYPTWVAGYKKNTRDTYNREIQPFFTKLESLKSLKEPLTVETLQDFLQTLRGAQESQRTQRTAIRAFLRYAASQGLCDESLYQSISVKPISRSVRPRPDKYHEPNRDQVINDEPNERNRVILWLAIGMRCTISEIVNLTWYDVDPDRKAITVYDGQERGQTIFLKDPIWSELIALRQGRNLDNYVFCGKRDRGLNQGQVRLIIENALKRSGIKAQVGEVCGTYAVKKREYFLL